jgi:hypothetical protein
MPDLFFTRDLFGRAADSAIASMSTSALALLSGVAYGFYKLILSHRREGWQGVKAHFAKDAVHGLIFGICWWALLFTYHLSVKVPSEIRMQADSAIVPLRSHAPTVPTFWVTKSPATHQHKAEIRLIFKDSPLFTPERKAHISAVIESFYRYLCGVGFTLPADIPPLGARPGRSISSAAIIPGSIYDAHLSLPEDKIDDPALIRALYSQWVFQDVIFGAYLVQGWPFSDDLATIYSCYYLSSFVDRDLCDYNWRNGEWVRALWDIRRAEGKQFTDKALLYTIKAWDPPITKPKDFNDLFAMRFIKGIGIRDNDFKHAELAGKILAQHSLGPSPQP